MLWVLIRSTSYVFMEKEKCYVDASLIWSYDISRQKYGIPDKLIIMLTFLHISHFFFIVRKTVYFAFLP